MNAPIREANAVDGMVMVYLCRGKVILIGTVAYQYLNKEYLLQGCRDDDGIRYKTT